MSWRFYNPNPKGRRVGDCTVRALCAALDLSWDEAYDLIAAKGKELKDMPSSNGVWGSVLRDRDFVRVPIPDTCPDCYTIGEFAEDNPTGLYVVGTGTHVVCVDSGIVLDSWDSRYEIPEYMWRRRQL